MPYEDQHSPARVHRRAFVTALAGSPLLPALIGTSAVAEPTEGEISRGSPQLIVSPGLIVREREPENLEYDFSSLNSFLTPNEAFYIRDHFPRPVIDAASWRLKIEGAVEQPLELSYAELIKLPAESKTVTLECAGNGRVYLVPKADGVQWQLGAAGTATWTGVPLATVLKRAGVNAGAVDVILEGADQGETSKPSKPGKPFHYSRSLPLARAQDGGVLLAFRMNGEPLPQAHGFPVRAIVPGWYGMASVKWLQRIVVTAEPYHGYFQSVDYSYWQHRDGFPTKVPITAIQVKAQIARPATNEVVPRGGRYRVYGAAWGGDVPIAKVELSTDGGKQYAAAKLLGEPVEHAWRLWEFAWEVPAEPGKQILMVRATDAKGMTQPIERDKDRESYMINHILPIIVEIR
jgi:DMSO/TMAO reductase YedYZ molybdopterin-dependent catalytic subunit